MGTEENSHSKSSIDSLLNFPNQMYDIWVRTSSEMLEQMMQTPAFAAGQGKLLEQSMELKQQVDQALEASLKSMRLATDSDVQALVTELKTIKPQVIHTTEALDTLIPELEKFLEQARQRDKELEASLTHVRSSIEPAIQSVLTELKTSQNTLAKITSSLEDLAGRVPSLENRLETLEKRLDQALETRGSE